MAKLSKYQTIEVSKVEIPNIITVVLNADDILEIQWDSTIGEITKNHLVQLKKIIQKLGKGKRIRLFFDTYAFMSISPEASEYSTTAEYTKFTLASAVLIDSLAKKMLFNFYLKVNNPLSPTKGFSTKDAAIEWLIKGDF